MCCGCEQEQEFLAKGKAMSGGRSFNKLDRLGLMAPERVLNGGYGNGFEGRGNAGRFWEAGRDWRALKPARMSLEGNVEEGESDAGIYLPPPRLRGWKGEVKSASPEIQNLSGEARGGDAGLKAGPETQTSAGGDRSGVGVIPNPGKIEPVESNPAVTLLGPRPVIRKGKTLTPQEAQEVRVWVLEDLKRNHPGFMKMDIQKRLKVQDEALAKVWSGEDQQRYDTSAFKDENANQALDAGDYQKLRIRAEELVKSAPGYAELPVDKRHKAFEAVALSLGKMTEKDFARAMNQRTADERGFWATVGGSAWGTLGNTAGSAVKLGERAYALGDSSYDVSKGHGEGLKKWGDDFEANSTDDRRTGAKLLGHTIGSTAPYLLAAPGLRAAGMGAKAIQYTLGATGAALSGNDAYDRGIERGMQGKELAAYVAGHGGLGALTSMIGIKGAAPGASVTGTLFGKALPHAAKGLESTAAKVLGQGGERALGKFAGATADGVVLGAGANTGSNILEKTLVNPDVGVFDNTGTAALSGGLGGAMGGLTRIGQEAIQKRLSDKYFGGGEPPKPGSPEAKQLSPAARVAMEILTQRRGLAQVADDTLRPSVEKGVQKGREALGDAARRGGALVNEVRDGIGALIDGERGGGPGLALANVGDEAPFGRTASGRPRMNIGGFVDDSNEVYMKGGAKKGGQTRDADGKVSLEGDIGDASSSTGEKALRERQAVGAETSQEASTQKPKLSAQEILGPYLEKLNQIYASDPIYLPESSKTEFKVVTGASLTKGRRIYNLSGMRGHHRHPIAHGGPAIPTEPGGLVFTGESQIPAKELDGLNLSFYGELHGKPDAKVLKIHQPDPGAVFRFGPNPRHTRVTNFWKEVERWQRENGVR
jgi:hypothetical protein